jgi:hypothetical protein
LALFGDELKRKPRLRIARNSSIGEMHPEKQNTIICGVRVWNERPKIIAKGVKILVTEYTLQKRDQASVTKHLGQPVNLEWMDGTEEADIGHNQMHCNICEYYASDQYQIETIFGKFNQGESFKVKIFAEGKTAISKPIFLKITFDTPPERVIGEELRNFIHITGEEDTGISQDSEMN